MRTYEDLIGDGYRLERLADGRFQWYRLDGRTYVVQDVAPDGGRCGCPAGRRGVLSCHVAAIWWAVEQAGPDFIVCPTCGFPMAEITVYGFRMYECVGNIAGHTMDARLIDVWIERRGRRAA